MDSAFVRGLRAGGLAGLLLIGIIFADYGPAANLSTVARWFALDGNPWSKLIGALFLVAFGGIFGGLFGIVVHRSRSLLQLLLAGLIAGLCWWVILVLLLSMVFMHIQQSLYGTLFWLVASLLYGLVLGSLYGQFRKQEGERERRMA